MYQAHAKKELEERPVDSAKEAESSSGGLMDVSGMAEMQAAIAAELKSKYEDKIRTLQAKLRILQAGKVWVSRMW